MLEEIVCNEAKAFKSVIHEQILETLKGMLASRNASISQSVAQELASNCTEMHSVEYKHHYKLPSENKSDDETEVDSPADP